MSTDHEPSMYLPTGDDGPLLPRWVPLAGLAATGGVGLVSLWLILSTVYGFGSTGILVALGVALVGALIGFGVSFIPLGSAGLRRQLRFVVAALFAVIALWAIHAAPYGDNRDRVAAAEAISGAQSVEDAHGRLQALAADNPYAAYALFEIKRRADTRAAIKAIFAQVKSDDVPWGLDFDPADKAGLQSLHSRLLDIDVLLSAVPDQVIAQLRKEREDLFAAATQAGLSNQFRAELQQSTDQRQKELATFYLALAATTRKAAQTVAEISLALQAGKATKGVPGAFTYGDDATRTKVEPLIAQLKEARGVIGKLIEAAKALDQRYGDGSAR